LLTDSNQDGCDFEATFKQQRAQELHLKQ